MIELTTLMEKIVFFEIEKWEEEYLRSALSGHDLVFETGKLNDSNFSKYATATIISPFIYSSLNKEILDALPNLKFIATRSMGFDHIDIGACKEKGVLVSNVPTYGSHTVAEHTFALILSLSRKIIPSVEQAREGDFSSVGLEGFDLYGKTLGVIGTGNIGKNVAKLGLAFGMNVLAFSRSEDQELVNNKVKYVALNELLSQSDVVSLHLPLSKETKHMINMENILKFKKGSLLINTARGGLIETQAIIEGLGKGFLGGAGLDVLEEEVELKEEREFLSNEYLKTVDLKTSLLNHVLLTKENVVITPHNAFNSREALIQILETTIANIKSYLDNKPQNLVSANL